MPLEGQWERQHTPLGRLAARERRLLAMVGVVAVAGVILAAVLLISSSPTRVARGCVQFTAPSTTGAAIVHSCGADAARLCQTQPGRPEALSQSLRQPCRRAGYGMP